MKLDRGYYWLSLDNGPWRIMQVESDGAEVVQILGEKESLKAEEIPASARVKILMTPNDLLHKKDAIDRSSPSFRRPMESIRNLFFVVNPERHVNQYRYRAHDDLAQAAQEAIRISKCNPKQKLYVMEATPIGLVIDGKTLDPKGPESTEKPVEKPAVKRGRKRS